MPKKVTPLTLYNLYARRAVALLGLVVVSCAFMYGFFLLEAVSHAASQAQTRHAIAQLSSKVGTLQARYLAATKALTPARAKELGFVEPAQVATVYAQSDNLSLTYER